MTAKGDDCYFFYYSTCTKGDNCPFRHCEAALGSETVCRLWQEQKCFRSDCVFRHMEIDKNRKEIPCYWENRHGGCQKPHCAFHHEKPRFIDGNVFPPDKGLGLTESLGRVAVTIGEAKTYPFMVKKENDNHAADDKANQIPTTSNHTNPQLRGVIRTDLLESIPSPTHPPVVINPVDDDDEDDQISDESEESPKKMFNSKCDGLNFGIQTLEEIRLRKTLLANLKKTGSEQNLGNTGVKENIKSFPRLGVKPLTESSGSEAIRKKVTSRLGKRPFNQATNLRDKESEKEALPLKLADGLGGIVESSKSLLPQKGQKPVRDRLGFTADHTSSNNETKSFGDVRIKTLEEIRQEKAARTLQINKAVRVAKNQPENCPPKKSLKTTGGVQVKSFPEILHEKKKRQEDRQKFEETSPAAKSPKKEGQSTENSLPKSTDKIKASGASAEVRVKTLEEIRKEKAARMQPQQQVKAEDKTTTSEPPGLPKRRILRVIKPSSAANSEVRAKKTEASDKKLETVVETNGKTDSSSQAVKVKTFEEIMREKKLRKLQEEQVTSTNQKEALAPSPPAAEPANQSKATELCIPKPDALQISDAVINKSSAELPAESQTGKTQEPVTSVVKLVQLIDGSVPTKVKPKVNVKPSVIKPTSPRVQKRKAAKVHHSAVAKVKPMNTTGQRLASLTHLDKKITGTTQVLDTQVPSKLDDVKEKPAISRSTAGASENLSQSPVISSASVKRTRRSNSATACPPPVTSSSMDDFEDLLDEFADDRLEDDLELDPGKGEDDLFLELSEMIDS